jgi:hypothetical protein
VIADIATGQHVAADWLFLIAAFFFAVAAAIAALQRPDPTHGLLVPGGLGLVAVALLIL